MAIDKAIKKQIIKDWSKAFPELTIYSQNTLYRIIGPVIVGLELVWVGGGEEYRPFLIMIPMWKDDAKTCMKFPMIFRGFYDKRNFQLTVHYKKHDVLFNEAVDCVRGQLPFLFDAEVSLKDLNAALDHDASIPPLNAAPNSYMQALLSESKMMINLFVGIPAAKRVLDSIQQRNWDEAHFRICDTDVSSWLQKMEMNAGKREELLSRIISNMEDEKIRKLQKSDLL